MDKLIYTAMSGMTDSMTRQRVIAANMANAQTIGFRAEMLYSTPVTLKGPALEARAMSSGEVKGADMRQGNVNATGNVLDIAMQGSDMMAVQAADGSEVYTRRGDLSVSATGVLSNGDGRPVIGNGGPITVPPDGVIKIGPDGSVLSGDPSNPNQPPTLVDKIKIASTDGMTIEKGLDGFFRVAGGGILPTNDDAKVTVGALEESNVSPSEVMVQMVQAQRLFDIRTKLLSTAKDIDQSGTSLLRQSASS
ncbi:MAG: flagellar basal body rod protein FlgF [Sphingomonadales bacterium]|nr:flagellar basal body rod protein FlgF [Sphingomonadales bacterium]MDE2169730.1 flagellar basal body rod protein FlgF [Sphingomonadales bacterium]